MTANDILLLALKHRVTAISKSDGRHLWCTELGGGGFGSSTGFITLACDDNRVFAYYGGHLHCLELSSGKLLWTDELRGYGFGLASLCVPGHGCAPDVTVMKEIMTESDASSAATAAST